MCRVHQRCLPQKCGGFQLQKDRVMTLEGHQVAGWNTCIFKSLNSNFARILEYKSVSFQLGELFHGFTWHWTSLAGETAKTAPPILSRLYQAAGCSNHVHPLVIKHGWQWKIHENPL